MTRAGTTVEQYRTFRVRSRLSGTSPTFLLLHGVGLSHRSFTPLARVLSEHGDVIAFDLPGFGVTAKPARQLSVEDYAAGIAGELDRLGTGPVIAVGHSMGAQFAIELARQRPELVDRLVLAAPVVEPARRSLAAQGAELALNAVLERPATQLMTVIGYLSCGFRWFLTEANAMLDYPTHLRIADVRHPVLVLRGEWDPIARGPWALWLSQQAQRGRLVTIPQRHHNVVHSEADATGAAIIAFASV